MKGRFTSQNGSPGTAQNKAQAAKMAAQVAVHSTHGGMGGIKRLGSPCGSLTEKGTGPAARAREMKVENRASCILVG